jgi:hypothetical protein
VQIEFAKRRCDPILISDIQFVTLGADKCTAYRRRNGSKYCQYETMLQNLAKTAA